MLPDLLPEIPGLDIDDLRLVGFKVHEVHTTADVPASRGRRDFYKMGIVTGNMTVHSGDKALEIDGTALFFVNPNAPHSVVRRGTTTGFACLFTDTFMAGNERSGILKRSPLFFAGDPPVIPLSGEQARFMTVIFKEMLAVYNGEYRYRGELIRHYIELVIHEALRIQPSHNEPEYKNGATRITRLFMDLLERQFPIERVEEPLKLKTAKAFSENLSVHVNYLNRSVKEVTGKPTTLHIAERITSEAKSLLQFTDWSVADIAYALGFEYPTYFNNYFKRMTGATPNTLRKHKV